SKFNVKVELGATWIFPSLQRLITAEESAGVAIVLEVNTDRPLFADSPLIKTDAALELAPLPITVKSPATLPGTARTTIEYVAITASIKHDESALRTHRLLVIFLLLNRQFSMISKK